jgi:transposase
MVKHNTIQAGAVVAGVDVSKARLDVALWPEGMSFSVDNDAAGWASLMERLREAGTIRVGLEASGGYERGVIEAVSGELDVIMLQPLQVRAFARFRGQRAKTDRIDAALIAECAAQSVRQALERSPECRQAADLLTLYEQTAADLARLRTRVERFREGELAALLTGPIEYLKTFRKTLLDRLRRLVRTHAELTHRVALLQTIPGVGFLNAISLAARVPELGQMTRQEAAALLGLAPFNHDSGTWQGVRHIAGGRARPRRLLYMAAVAAIRCDPDLRAFHRRLTAAGKPHNVAVVAVMRKLAAAANTVLKRGTPWLPAEA